jgi:endonuclease/exonuclease/phosphatase family metal-dependent hydrolase
MPTLRVMTFNIRGSSHSEDGVNIWDNRAQLNVETIKRANPDLIGFQELEEGNLATYQKWLPGYEYMLGPQSSNEEPRDRNAIFWKPSQLQRIDCGHFWLSETPEIASTGWGATTMRTAIWARFKLANNGRELLSFNTHLDHIRERARREGIRLILQRITQMQGIELPVIITGDFNCNPDTAVHRLLSESGFTDTYLATGHIDSEYTNTFHAYGWTKPSSSGAQREGSMRLDWILLQDKGLIRPLFREIMRDAKPPLYPSDHYPVLAELEVQ